MLLRANFKKRSSGNRLKRNRETAAEAYIQSLLDQCHLKGENETGKDIEHQK